MILLSVKWFSRYNILLTNLDDSISIFIQNSRLTFVFCSFDNRLQAFERNAIRPINVLYLWKYDTILFETWSEAMFTYTIHYKPDEANASWIELENIKNRYFIIMRQNFPAFSLVKCVLANYITGKIKLKEKSNKCRWKNNKTERPIKLSL